MWAACVFVYVKLRHLQLRGEYGFQLQANNVLVRFQCRWRPLLVAAQVLQRLLSSISGLELVHHLTRQQISTLVTPLQRLQHEKTH